jgi:hypothetical protein
MALPVMMLTVVNRLDAAATDLIVSATVPAPLPSGTAEITSLNNGDTVPNQDIVVSGTCPIIDPAIIVAIYNNDVLAGSAPCSPGGTFSVSIQSINGTNALVPKIVTITNEIGASGSTVTVTWLAPSPDHSDSPGIDPGMTNFDSIGLPLRVVPTDIFAIINADGNTTWRGRFAGGTSPYQIQVDWGDGHTDTFTVNDTSEQTYRHDYEKVQSYDITIEVTDVDQSTATMHVAGVTRFVNLGVTGLDANLNQLPPVVAFIQQNAVQIYTVTLSGLVFLWYLEHGRHLAVAGTKIVSIKIHKTRLRH